MWETDFAISCSQCGGQEFREIFPVPAEVYHLYGPKAERDRPRQLVSSVYACLQCGHLEKFVDFSEEPADADDPSC